MELLETSLTAGDDYEIVAVSASACAGERRRRAELLIGRIAGSSGGVEVLGPDGRAVSLDRT